jgi:hypothetical protein
MFWPQAFYFLYEAKKAFPFKDWPVQNSLLPFRTRKSNGFPAKVNGFLTVLTGIIFLFMSGLCIYAFHADKEIANYRLQIKIKAEELRKKSEQPTALRSPTR